MVSTHVQAHTYTHRLILLHPLSTIDPLLTFSKTHKNVLMSNWVMHVRCVKVASELPVITGVQPGS